jgi:lipoprotein-anchoring transpeptidase ErfK/SrfK
MYLRKESPSMRTALAAVTLLVLSVVPAAAQAPASSSGNAKPASGLDRTTLHVQVILDKLGFSPGVLDGREGQSLTAALRGFQTSRGLAVTGKADQPTLRALSQYRAIRPTKTLTLTPAMLAGPFVNPTPKEYADQAKLKGLYYRSPLEKLAEMFHTKPEVLVELNSRETPLTAGTKVVFPNALPGSRDYAADTKADWRATLSGLNVDANQPKGERIVVDKSEGVLKVYDKRDRLVAQFSATMGSEKDPLPLGNWKVQGISPNPPFHFNPDLFWDADAKDKKALLPPGPNGPVGVVWLDLSKPHYGIHGTPNPATIGRTESHGCIRLTNWDAARLALIIDADTPAVFQT